ncbi:hypothetical protein FACS189479_05750 [Spirochaetia bacterium]|nr:hypothetical protein FACS189479_05750 [Spirochaetia bacterium]
METYEFTGTIKKKRKTISVTAYVTIDRNAKRMTCGIDHCFVFHCLKQSAISSKRYIPEDA